MDAARLLRSEASAVVRRQTGQTFAPFSHAGGPDSNSIGAAR